MNFNYEPNEKRLLISQFYTEQYFDALITMIYSARKNGYKGDVGVMVLKNQSLSYKASSAFKKMNITVFQVPGIPAPAKPLYDGFKDQFTKLRIFEFIQYDRVLYVDADCLVVGNLDPLFTIKKTKPIAAVNDVWETHIDHTFNAGVLSVAPSLEIFNRLMKLMKNTDEYDPKFAEQTFLNKYCLDKVLLLPLRYNFNSALYYRQVHEQLFRQIFPEAVIIHYTLNKPFKTGARNILTLPWYDYRDMAFAELEK